MAYPVLADVNSWLGVSGEDSIVTVLLNSAIAAVEGFCNTKFISTSVTDESYDGDGARFLLLRNRPVISVSSVSIEGNAVSSDLYDVNANQSMLVLPQDVEGYDARLRLYNGMLWPRGTANILVSYNYGYATTPADVTHAIYETISYFYGRRKSLGITSESLGPRSVVWAGAVTGGFSLPAEVKGLLRAYVQHEVRG